MIKIGSIGAGNMAEALMKGILKADLTSPKEMIMSDINQARLRELNSKYGPRITTSNREVVESSEIVILAVKPQIMSSVLSEISPVNKNKLFISIAAGIPLSLLRDVLGSEARIIRVMPNTPALVLEGMTAICSDGVEEKDMETAERIFSAIGRVVKVPEKLFDIITGLSGSGPAYIAVIIEALTDGGVLMGLPRKTAEELVLQTIEGTVRLLKESLIHPASLKDMVSSPGGTTIHGLYVLEKAGLRASLMEAIKAATLRSKELANNQGEKFNVYPG